MRHQALNAANAWILAGAILAAMVGSASDAQSLEFYHLDAVGSVRVVSDGSGQVIERHDYLPFGEECTTGLCAGNQQVGAGQPRKFTGKERDAETGLDYFGARYYMASTGRFTTVDPKLNAVASLATPQKWNRYAYALSNPVAFVDPDGREEYRILIGDPGIGEHNVGRNFLRAGETRAQALRAAGHTVTITRVSSVDDFSRAISTGEEVTKGLLFFGHAGRLWSGESALFPGERPAQAGAPDPNLHTGNIALLPAQHKLGAGCEISLLACNSATPDGGGTSVAETMSARLERRTTGYTGYMIFSTREDGPDGREVPPATGPLYLVPDRNSESATFGE